MDLNTTVDKDEFITINIEQVDNIENWKSLLFELVDKEMIVSVNEERFVTDNNFMNQQGFYTIQIVCSVESFVEIAPQLRELDENDMLSVKRTYQELEDFYYEYEWEEEE